MWSCAIADGKLEKIDLGTERGLGGGYAPAPRGCLALLHDGVRYRLARFERGATGWKRTPVDGAHVANLDAIRTSRDGRILAYRMSSATAPAQWYTARLDGSALEDPRRITDLNKAFDAKPKGRAEVVRWKGARGEEVEGVLLYPLDQREATARPLVLDIHGGPTGVDRDTWSVSWASPHLLWRQKGALVLQVNYHGSVGYGLDWAESIGAGNYYDLEIPDIERGVDALIARGLVDPNKLATTGWSNGGILGVELITRSGRYKAASIDDPDLAAGLGLSLCSRKLLLKLS